MNINREKVNLSPAGVLGLSIGIAAPMAGSAGIFGTEKCVKTMSGMKILWMKKATL